MAKIYLRGGTEKVLINAVREAYYQPFQATDWTDLRVGFFLSVCGNTDPGEDNTITGLTEELGTPPRPLLPWSDRFSIGLIDKRTGTVFLGYTNVFASRPRSVGTSKLVSSDIGIGTSNAFFWRPTNEMSNLLSVKILDNSVIRASGGPGSQLHLVQDTTGAGGYATLVGLRFQRDDPRGRRNIITMSVKQGTNNGDILYSNDPSETNLLSNLEDFPDTVQQLGPVQLSQTPDTLWAYWPFTASRLRIHCYGILKAA